MWRLTWSGSRASAAASTWPWRPTRSGSSRARAVGPMGPARGPHPRERGDGGSSSESAAEGLVALASEGRGSGPGAPVSAQRRSAFARVHQAVKLLMLAMLSPSSGMYSCPLAMTDGAAFTLDTILRERSAALPRGTVAALTEAYVHLTTRDPDAFWTSGQWFTERKGGERHRSHGQLAPRRQARQARRRGRRQPPARDAGHHGRRARHTDHGARQGARALWALCEQLAGPVRLAHHRRVGHQQDVVVLPRRFRTDVRRRGQQRDQAGLQRQVGQRAPSHSLDRPLLLKLQEAMEPRRLCGSQHVGAHLAHGSKASPGARVIWSSGEPSTNHRSIRLPGAWSQHRAPGVFSAASRSRAQSLSI